MKKLCVFTLYAEKGASSQYRAYIFKEELEKHFDLTWYTFWNDAYATKYMHNKKKYIIPIIAQYITSCIRRFVQLLFIAPKYDVVFIQKASIPKLKNTFLKRIKNSGTRIVFDVDDAVYAAKNDNSNMIASVADCVVCGNDTLRKHYSEYSSNCVVLPTVENTYKYEKYWTNSCKEKIIGWIGSKTTVDNFDLVIESLNEVTRKHPEVKIAIISNTALDYTDRINNSYLVPWNKETYIEELSKFSIGIMPLKDNEINRGKCGFKLIQYLNMKKPVIGSNVGVNGEIIEGNGIVADSKEEWAEAIEKLLYDPDFYLTCVEHINNTFLKKYHFSIVSRQLIEILNG